MNELYELQEHLQKAQHCVQKIMQKGGQMGQRNGGGYNGGGGNSGGNGNYNQRGDIPYWLKEKMWQGGEDFDPRWM